MKITYYSLTGETLVVNLCGTLKILASNKLVTIDKINST